MKTMDADCFFRKTNGEENGVSRLKSGTALFACFYFVYHDGNTI